MRNRHAVIIASLLLGAVAACGGSGSTGLVSPEGAVLDEVRRDGTCVTSDQLVTYCATDSPDAVAPDGASASGPFDDAAPGPTPARTATAASTSTPGGPTPSAQPTAAGSPTSVPTATLPSTATPSPAHPTTTPTPQGCIDDCPETLAFRVRGLPDGAACALAARPDGSDDSWATGALVDAGGTSRGIEPPLPVDVGSGRFEIALLCFQVHPEMIPERIATLSAAAPDVVFAPEDRIEIEEE